MLTLPGNSTKRVAARSVDSLSFSVFPSIEQPAISLFSFNPSVAPDIGRVLAFNNQYSARSHEARTCEHVSRESKMKDTKYDAIATTPSPGAGYSLRRLGREGQYLRCDPNKVG